MDCLTNLERSFDVFYFADLVLLELGKFEELLPKLKGFYFKGFIFSIRAQFCLNVSNLVNPQNLALGFLDGFLIYLGNYNVNRVIDVCFPSVDCLSGRKK